MSLSLLVLKTHQVEALRDFYGSLGINLVKEKHGNGPIHFAGDAGGVVFEIYPLKEGEETDRSTRLGFVVDDLDGLLETLGRRESSIVASAKRTEWGYRAVVGDPDGRSVELYER